MQFQRDSHGTSHIARHTKQTDKQTNKQAHKQTQTILYMVSSKYPFLKILWIF